MYSAIKNTKERLTIRSTWGQSQEYYPVKVRVVFSLALPSDATDQDKIYKEQETFGDLVQDGMFIDNYRNLTYKVIQHSIHMVK